MENRAPRNMMDDGPRGNDSDAVAREVKRLFKHGGLTPSAAHELRQRLNNDKLYDAVIDQFQARHRKVRRMAEEFVEAFFRKHSVDTPTHKLASKMRKYKERYNLSDEEFDEAMKLFNLRIYEGRPQETMFNNTNMSKVLGHPILENRSGIKTTSQEDYGVLMQIVRHYAAERPLHSQVFLQTLTYKEDSKLVTEVETAKYTANRNIYHQLHPVIVAMFAPKIDGFENRMLFASIAGIVNTVYERQLVKSKPDFDLLYALLNDPNDVVCGNGAIVSPMQDLLDRAKAQSQLWAAVLNMRQGKFFEPTNLGLIAALDNCRVSNLDNPDLVYLSDEAVFLRRLMSIFAYRPITVFSRPIGGQFAVPQMGSTKDLTGFANATGNPYGVPAPSITVSSIPYITVRLPQQGVKLPEGFNSITPKLESLKDALSIPQFFVENGAFVYKQTSVMHINGPLVFHVPRRSMRLPFQQVYPYTYSFINPENSISPNGNFHMVNKQEINIPRSIQPFTELEGLVNDKMQKDTYVLRSATYIISQPDDGKYANVAISVGAVICHATGTEVGKIQYVYNTKKQDINSEDNVLMTMDKSKLSVNLQNSGTIFIYDKAEGTIDIEKAKEFVDAVKETDEETA